MSKAINILLISLGVFGLSFTWFFYYSKILWISYVASIGLTCVVGILLFAISRSQNIRKDKKITDKRKIGTLKLYLIMNTSIDIFEKTFKNQGYCVNRKNSHSFVAEKDEKIFVSINFSFKKLSDQDIVAPTKLATYFNCTKLYIFCADFDSSAKELCKILNRDIRLAEINETYRFLQSHDALPELKETEKAKKPVSKILYFALSKKRFPYYFWNAVFLALFAQITFFPLYNMIVASLLLILAIYSKFNKRFNHDADLMLI